MANVEIRSEIAKHILVYLQTHGVDLDTQATLDVQEDLVSIYYLEQNENGVNFIHGILIDQNDEGWTVFIKRPIEVTTLNRTSVLEYVNKLNEDSLDVISHAGFGEESGLVAKLSRTSKVPGELLADLDMVRNFAVKYFSGRI